MKYVKEYLPKVATTRKIMKLFSLKTVEGCLTKCGKEFATKAELENFLKDQIKSEESKGENISEVERQAVKVGTNSTVSRVKIEADEPEIETKVNTQLLFPNSEYDNAEDKLETKRNEVGMTQIKDVLESDLPLFSEQNGINDEIDCEFLNNDTKNSPKLEDKKCSEDLENPVLKPNNSPKLNSASKSDSDKNSKAKLANKSLEKAKRDSSKKMPRCTFRCDECEVELTKKEVTDHIVTNHKNQRMDRCKSCDSGLMLHRNYVEHRKVFHNKSNPPKRTSKAKLNKADSKSNAGVSHIENSLNDSVETVEKIENFLKSPQNEKVEEGSNRASSIPKISFLKTGTPKRSRSLNPEYVKSDDPSKRLKIENNDLRKPIIPKTKSNSKLPEKKTNLPELMSSFEARQKGRQFDKKQKKTMNHIGLALKHYNEREKPEAMVVDIVEGKIQVVSSGRPERYWRLSKEIPDTDDRQ